MNDRTERTHSTNKPLNTIQNTSLPILLQPNRVGETQQLPTLVLPGPTKIHEIAPIQLDHVNLPVLELPRVRLSVRRSTRQTTLRPLRFVRDVHRKSLG